MAYLLDADVFIRAKNLHYGLDFCPAFWDWGSASVQTDALPFVSRLRRAWEPISSAGC